MTWIEALILGLLQGLTEFLPVSSSGHLELGKSLLGLDPTHSIVFTIVVHGATVLSTVIVFRKDILILLKGLAGFKWNEETRYVARLLFSAVPVIVAGFFFRDEVEGLYNGNVRMVGCMLIFTSLLLMSTYIRRKNTRKVSFFHAFIMGIAQVIAVIPGVSRSGATISAGLILGNKKENVARFSFLMVLFPIIGANLLDFTGGRMSGNADVDSVALLVGFFAAFVSGLLACKWMINIVKKGKLVYFAVYCLIVGLISIIAG
ncbi:MAG: undecaprenyl-diphosphate phosphatase [Bacteroidales bacterium]